MTVSDSRRSRPGLHRRGGTAWQRRCLGMALLLLPVVHAATIAQQRLDPVAIGMGKASVASARGLSALGSNIGALGLDALGRYDSLQRIELDFSILPLGASAGSTYLNTDDLNFVFDTKDSGVFTDADRMRIGDLIEEGRLAADAAVDVFALRLRVPRIGALGIHYTHRVRAQMSFPENFRKEVLGGGDVFGRDQTFTNPEIGGEWTRSLSAALASAWERPDVDPRQSSWFPAFGIGMSLGYVEGIVHFDVDPTSQASTRVLSPVSGQNYRSIEVRGHYTFRTSEPIDSNFTPADAVLKSAIFSGRDAAGSGWEGGFGMSMVIFRSLRKADVEITGSPLEAEQVTLDDAGARDALLFGLSIEGIGSLQWSGKNLLRSYPEILDTLTDELGGISNDVIYRYQTKLDTIGSFRTQLPALLRVGLAGDLTAFLPDVPGDLLASVEGAFDLNDAIGGERDPRFSIGAEWRPTDVVSIRSGLQLGGRVGSALALGVGVRPFRWLAIDAATSEFTSLFYSDRRRIDAALRIMVGLRL